MPALGLDGQLLRKHVQVCGRLIQEKAYRFQCDLLALLS